MFKDIHDHHDRKEVKHFEYTQKLVLPKLDSRSPDILSTFDNSKHTDTKNANTQKTNFCDATTTEKKYKSPIEKSPLHHNFSV